MKIASIFITLFLFNFNFNFNFNFVWSSALQEFSDENAPLKFEEINDSATDKNKTLNFNRDFRFRILNSNTDANEIEHEIKNDEVNFLNFSITPVSSNFDCNNTEIDNDTALFDFSDFTIKILKRKEEEIVNLDDFDYFDDFDIKYNDNGKNEIN